MNLSSREKVVRSNKENSGRPHAQTGQPGLFKELSVLTPDFSGGAFSWRPAAAGCAPRDFPGFPVATPVG